MAEGGGINLKKKIGPLPTWGWAVLGVGTLGIVYYLHKRNASSSSSSGQSATDAELAAEQDAAASGYPYAGDSGSSTGADTSLPAEVASDGSGQGSWIENELSAGFGAIQDQLAALSLAAPTDNTAATTTSSAATGVTSLAGLPIKQQLADVAAGADPVSALGPNALKQFEKDLSPTPAPTATASPSVTSPKGSTPAATGKSIAGLTIIEQLDDLQAGLVTKSQLGPNAAAALSSAGGNIDKAITARQAAQTPAPAPKVNQTAVKKATE